MKYLLGIVLFIGSQYCQAQSVDQYHLKGMMVIAKDKDGDYLYHKDWKDIQATAFIDATQKRIAIIGNAVFNFDINSAQNPYRDKENNLILKFICTDSKGKICWISLITLVNPIDNYQNFIKVSYGDLDLMYRYIE